MNKRTIERVDGRLIGESGETFPITLHATVVSLGGADGIAEVSNLSLASGDCPDGDYTLEFFFFRPHRDPVQVKNGALAAR